MKDNLVRLEMSRPTMTVWKRFRFEAAHWLPNVPNGHKCKHIHGHSYEVQVGVTGQLDPKLEWVVDYAEIKAAFEEWLFILDHNNLNSINGLANSTAENLALWIAEKLKPRLPGLSMIRVLETPDAWVEFIVR